MRHELNTIRLNTIRRKYVPLFLAVLCLIPAGACERSEPDAGQIALDGEEIYFVEQYLRLVEARHLAVSRDSLAQGVFAFLETDLPADSLRAIARRVSEEDPERWALIFEEIARRKKIMEAQRR